MKGVTAELDASTVNERRIVEMSLFQSQLEKRLSKIKTERGKQNAIKNQPIPTFNWGSGAQVGHLLFEVIGLPPHKTKKGGWATDAVTMEKLAPLHAVPELFSKRNTYSNYLANFVDGLLSREIDGRIHPSFNPSGTRTRRLSHSNPNLGNQPSRGDWKKIRNLYVPDEGMVFCKSDYSQLEICITGHYTGDKRILEIIYDGASQHDITAEGVGIDRDIAKRLNFAILYGCSVYKVAEIVGCSVEDAEGVLEKYWQTYPGLKQFIDWAQGQVEKGKPLANAFGGLRHFPKPKADWQLAKQKRQAFNFCTQSTGAECTNAAYYLADEALRKTGLGHCVLSVHDEILIAAKEEHWQDALDVLNWIMVDVGRAAGLRVPLSVDGEGGLTRWKK